MPPAWLANTAEYWSWVNANPIVAPFEAGRALNCLRFHLVQAKVVPRSEHPDLSRRHALALARIARYLRTTASSSEDLEHEVRRRVDESLHACGEEWYLENLSEFREELDDPFRLWGDPPEAGDLDAEREEVVRRLGSMDTRRASCDVRATAT